MSRLLKVYRAVYEQGFLPIFVQDGRDAKPQVEACVQAGMKVIEYTLRRSDAPEMIPWIRDNYPGLYLLVGSTLDDDTTVRRARVRNPWLLTLSEMADMGVDGFISMIGWSEENIRRFAPTHLLAPSAMTVREAFVQLAAGATFIKVTTADMDTAKRCRAVPTYGACPLMVSGGVTPGLIPELMGFGVAVVAAGFDVMLKDKPIDVSTSEIVEGLSVFLDATRAAREKCQPEVLAAFQKDDREWLRSLSHITPFDEEVGLTAA